jgi:phosphoglycolate phosphatase-like HAD superfamily hydrolase
VACALAAHATAVGVATGSYTVDQLRTSGADVVFRDLSDGAAFDALLA